MSDNPMAPISIALHALYTANKEAGFSDDQALELAKDFQRSIVSPMIQPIVQGQNNFNAALNKFLEEE